MNAYAARFQASGPPGRRPATVTGPGAMKPRCASSKSSRSANGRSRKTTEWTLLVASVASRGPTASSAPAAVNDWQSTDIAINAARTIFVMAHLLGESRIPPRYHAQAAPETTGRERGLPANAWRLALINMRHGSYTTRLLTQVALR